MDKDLSRMDYKLAKCARCERLFTKVVSDVCTFCQPAEDADYNRIHEVISRTHGLNAIQVAEEAEVSVECVYRMLREGRIDNVESEEKSKCGRCGAPAISVTKRLCQKCLMNLDRECAQAMMEMRQRIRAKNESDMNDVMAAVAEKRASHKERRLNVPPPVTAPRPQPGRRMVVQERLDKKGK